MPSRLIHYLIAEKVAGKIKINDMNRFRLGSICPDMSTRSDGSKKLTHFAEEHGDVKGGNWMTFLSKYGDRIEGDDLYLGILCHLVTDTIWFHDIIHSHIRVKTESPEERKAMCNKGYADFHRLNYILKNEFDLKYELTEDRNIDFEGLHLEYYDDLVGGLFKDICEEPKASKDELEIYTYDISIACILSCIDECVNVIKALRDGGDIPSPEKYYVPIMK